MVFSRTNMTLPGSLNNEVLATFEDSTDSSNIQAVAIVEVGNVATGALASLNATLALDVSNAGSVAITFAGTYSATPAFEVSIDGTNWFPIRAMRLSTGLLYASLALTTTEAWVCDTVAFSFFRVRLSAFVSGSCTVTMEGCRTPVGYQVNDVGALVAGTAVIGYTALTTKTTAGTSFLNVISAATTNATLVKAAAGLLYKLHVSNSSASWRYVKVYQKATAPVPGTDTPILVFGVAPGDNHTFDFGDIGITLATGIGIAITGLPALLDATAIAASEVCVAVQFA